jgi:hypothetical protein
LALITPVMTSTEGRCVAMMRWMPAARLFCEQALDEDFDLLADRDHEVRQFVDDDDDLRQHLIIELLLLEQFLAGIGIEADLRYGGQAACPCWRQRGPSR